MTLGAQPGALWLPRGVGWGGRWEGGSRGREHMILIHAVVWQEPTKHCKAIILQSKMNKSKTVNIKTLFSIFSLIIYNRILSKLLVSNRSFPLLMKYTVIFTVFNFANFCFCLHYFLQLAFVVIVAVFQLLSHVWPFETPWSAVGQTPGSFIIS